MEISGPIFETDFAAIFIECFVEFGFSKSLNTWKDETPCELGHDPETKQGCWILDKEDRRYIVKSFLYFKLFYIFILNYGFSLCDLRKLLTEKVHFPKKMMLFAAVGTCLPKPYWEFIEIGSRLNAKK